MTAARRDVEGGLEVHRVPHLTSAWLVSRVQARDAWLAAGTGAWRPYPGGLIELHLPTRRAARALRALLLAAVPDWGAPPLADTGRGLAHPDADAWKAAVALVRMADRVNARRVRGLCLGCGLAPGMCYAWEARFGPRYAAEDLAWIR